MSEAPDVPFAVESRETSDSESVRPQSDDADEDRDRFEKSDESETPKSENASTPATSDEAEKNVGGVVPDAKPLINSTQPRQQQQQQQSRSGEYNLLPVLVERLRSALELSCSSRKSGEDQQPFEDSGVDSEEGLRLWTSMGLTESEAIRPKLDLKFLEELLLSDLQTALARLQDTLKRTDIGTLIRYSSTLDPPNKLHLLRLISNLLAKLKIPEEATVKPEVPARSHASRRRRADRHTIGVSSEEIARARKWLEDSSSNQSTPNFNAEKQVDRNDSMDTYSIEPTIQFDKVRDKCMKDAINQQQSLQIKNRESNKEYNSCEATTVLTVPRKFDGFCKDDSVIDQFEEKNVLAHYPQQNTPSKYNKYTAKKSKLKRANTIDIPSYLKQSEDNYGHSQNGCNFLRKPINISDKVVFNSSNVVPSFEPKTENDRKFLALINKNTDSVPASAAAPFKSFNYRQKTSVADKNWTNRFSNIKTTFDKPQTNEQEERKECSVSSSDEKDTVVGTVRMPQKRIKNIPNGFTHAPTSAFQKIEKSPPKTDSAPFFKTAYLPKSGGLLQEKLKRFDNEVHCQEEVPISHSTMPGKFKDKPTKTIKSAFSGHPTSDFENVTENGHLNYQSFCKQFMPFTNHTTSDKRSSVAAKSKFLENLSNEEKMHDNKHMDKPRPLGKILSPSQDSAFAKTLKNSMNSEPDNNQDFAKLYNYHKQYDVCPINIMQEQANLSHTPDYGYDSHYSRKPLQKFTRENFEACVQDSDFKRPDKPMRMPQHIEIPRFNAPVQHVGVQTTTVPTRPHSEYEPELIYSQSYPTPMANLQSRSNASVQATMSPPNIMQYTYQKDQVPSSPKLARNFHHPRTSIYDHPKPFHAYQSYSDSNYTSNPIYQRSDYSAAPCYTHNQSSHETLTHSHVPQEMPQNLYSNFCEHQHDPVLPEYPLRSYDDQIQYIQPTPSFQPEVPEIKTDYAPSPVYSPNPYGNEQLDHQQQDEEHIQNQDISSDGVVTRYTSAIATVSSQSVSPESFTEVRPPPKVLKPIIPCPSIDTPVLTQQVIKKLPIYHPDRKFPAGTPIDVIQRHNLLQQSLVRRLQSEKDNNKSARRFSHEVTQKESRLVTSPSFNSGNYSGKVNALKQAYEPSAEGYNTQDKINLFEEKNPSKQHFRPLSIPSKGSVRPDSFPPKMNVANSSSRQYNSKFRNNQSANAPIDSSDEYLMSCANKPSRLVLSKSESWHQLTRGTGGNLQVPQTTPQNLPPVGPQLLKPPKPKSPLAVRYTKQYEASCSDNVRKMEEKIQRYFHDSSTTVMNEEPKQEKKESKSKRNLTTRRNNSLVRSRTMPHVYDDKLLDDNVDVDKAFDSLFIEATRSDDRC